MCKSNVKVALEDFLFICIECSNCRSQILVGIATLLSTVHGFEPLSHCPICAGKFDSTLVPAVKGFQEAFAGSKGMEKISFHVMGVLA